MNYTIFPKNAALEFTRRRSHCFQSYSHRNKQPASFLCTKGWIIGFRGLLYRFTYMKEYSLLLALVHGMNWYSFSCQGDRWGWQKVLQYCSFVFLQPLHTKRWSVSFSVLLVVGISLHPFATTFSSPYSADVAGRWWAHLQIKPSISPELKLRQRSVCKLLKWRTKAAVCQSSES